MKDWKEIYKKKFGLCSEKSDKCDCYKELKFISDLIAQTREETIRAIPEEMKHDQETDSEESKTWIAGFNNCRNQILNKLKK